MNIVGTETPYQLQCFLDLKFDEDVNTCGDIQLDGDGIYAVAKDLKPPPLLLTGQATS